MTRTFLPSPLAQPEIERIWLEAAAQMGLRIERTGEAYASSDGRGRIQIGHDNLLDGDDAVAQLIFHEICHALVEGERGWTLPDWGLDNGGAGDVTREHACLRLQAHLAAPHGLRALMAPTTEYRAYHDGLPAEVLVEDGDPAVGLAREAAARAATAPWREALARGLTLTAAWLRAGAGVGLSGQADAGGDDARDADAHDADADADAGSGSGASGHPSGFGVGPGGQTCGTCAWKYHGGRGRPVLRCRQTAGQDGIGRRTGQEIPACARWEAPVDCHACGACCREAYHSVTVSVRDPVVWRQPALIMRQGHRFEILREGNRCAALAVQSAEGAPAATRGAVRFHCSIYADRPQACRDFEAGGRHCLDARRRVGLSR